MVTAWLVYRTVECAFCVQALARVTALSFFDKTLDSHSSSVHPDAEQNTNPVMTTVASHLESGNGQMK